jgi:hypothetical protein
MPTKRTIALSTLGAALALALAGCGGGYGSGGGNSTSTSNASAGGGGGKTVTVKLSAQNGSGESGTATLTPMGSSQTKVVVDLSNAPMAAQPAHIHKGSCAKLDPTPAYALQNVTHGKSQSTVNVALGDLTKGSFAINVHKSQTDLATYVACGNIGSGGGGSSSGGGYGY